MAATRTRNDLVNEALMNLGILAAGQAPTAEDFDAVDGKVDAMFAYLEKAMILDIDTVDDLQPEWFGPLAVILADDSALMFGLPGIPASPSNPNPRLAAEDRLRQVTYGRPTYEPQKTEYF